MFVRSRPPAPAPAPLLVVGRTNAGGLPENAVGFVVAGDGAATAGERRAADVAAGSLREDGPLLAAGGGDLACDNSNGDGGE